jgi:hypothetical protein
MNNHYNGYNDTYYPTKRLYIQEHLIEAALEQCSDLGVNATQSVNRVLSFGITKSKKQAEKQ